MALSVLLYVSLLIAGTLATPVQIRSSPITLPLALKIKATGGTQALVGKDRARYRALVAHGQAKANGKRANVPVPVTNVHTTYTASVKVGADTYNLLVDTGSSNTWVGANKPYKPGPSSNDTGETVSVSYGSGSFSGEEFLDEVTLGPVTVDGQSIGVANKSTGISSGIDGILGIGPTDLTDGTTSGGGTFPTVIDNLASQGSIDSALVGVSFVPTISTSDEETGQLDLGDTNPDNFNGDITYVPITSTSPASTFWGIDQSVTYGTSGTKILSSTAGIVDTGTTLVMLATDAFQAYQQATGAKPDNATGLLKIDDPHNLESLFFHVGGTKFEFTANAQMWPRKLNAAIGGKDNATYLIISDNGAKSGQGLDFVNGFTFLQRFYSVYDTANSRVGLATTDNTLDESN